MVLQCPHRWLIGQKQQCLVIENWQELISLAMMDCAVVETDYCLAFEVSVNGWKEINACNLFQKLSVSIVEQLINSSQVNLFQDPVKRCPHPT